ncbi:MAG: GAF domain-containing protein [Parachlamydiales bacterium]|nr:GAF domain-containing protein [Parachlamydiales bacterium]
MENQALLSRIDQLNIIGRALSAEKDHTTLLEMILKAAKKLTNANAGTLYTVQPDKKLRFEFIINDQLSFFWKRSGATALFPTDDIPLYNEDMKPNDHMVVVYCVNQDKTVNIADAYSAYKFDFSGTRKFDQKTGYHCTSMLTVPMKNHDGEIIGVLQLINAQNDQKIVPFSETDQSLVESLASQAAVAMTNQALIQGLKELFESFIKVLADAIDQKSPVTGRHCQRVPVIAMLLAQAVNQMQEGPLKEARFTLDQLYELEIAALLHDCGKVVTPVNVVEKATKLEAIYDRILDLETRIMVLKKDALLKASEAKLALLQKQLNDHTIEFQKIDADTQIIINKYDQDIAFLKECNQGHESSESSWKDRIKEISSYPWQVNGQNVPFLSEDEVTNLLIEKGTLTAEERKIIQNHVVMTKRMLDQIPYPKNLKDVPEIASCHHERIDGKGYPAGLTRFQMSLRARILAIADIFEALTAPDRPYKKPMPLSKALAIMETLKKEGHLDPDLFDVFINQKVYLTYARKNLVQDQIDVQ